MIPPRLRTLVAVGALLLSGGCGDSALGPRNGALLELLQAHDRWQAANFRDYEYTIDVSCFCLFRGPARVQVTDGVITSVTLVASGERLVPPEEGWYPSIEEVFAELLDALSRDDARATVTYDAVLGFPRTASIDRYIAYVDDEVGYTISDFTSFDVAAAARLTSRSSSP